METKNDLITKFMWFMYNRWNQQESVGIFGDNIGQHIYFKYIELVNERNMDILYWYSTLDKTSRMQLINRVEQCYD